ncbi:MAG: MDR family oxidoreductase [Salinivenus sp.]
MFDALILDRANGSVAPSVRSLSLADVPGADGDEVRLKVLYSSLNYKDALAVTGKGNIIRGEYPIVPGIDLVGVVLEADADMFSPGDRVIGTGWQLGEVDWGGYTQRARVAARKLVPLPEGLSPKQAMVAGTAGFTAMLSVMALQEHAVTPDQGDVVVTGASGGAGSMAVSLLARRGYDVVASTGSDDAHEYLRACGASRIVPRTEFDEGPDRPMESGRWAGAVDAVGGKTLATLIAQLQRHGSVASFGNAGGHELHTTVFPFILRGVNLLGIDSNTCPNDRRLAAWERLASLLTEADFEHMTARTIGLSDVPAVSEEVLDGVIRGRVVVDVQA